MLDHIQSVPQATTIGLKEDALARVGRWAEHIFLPLLALFAGLLVFSVFLLTQGKSPVEFFNLVYKAGVGSWFSWQNTLSRAAPLILAALCVALPARLGLMIIGGEGAIALGGLASGAVALLLAGASAWVGIPVILLAGVCAGAGWLAIIGALRHYRGVNETISSLLMAYIAIALLNHFVEGVLRDPNSLNKPSTAPVAEHLRVTAIPGMDVHWGLVAGIVLCIGFWVLIEFTVWGFAARMVGGNSRAATGQGLPTGRLIIAFTAMGGACAGLAGAFEVTAVHNAANASLLAGYGYTGILIAFLARHNPLVIIPVAILMACFEASSGLVQRRMDLPDATILVLQGVVFIAILLSETLYGRLRLSRLRGPVDAS
jgi:simple sugar transport system permease protein